MFEEFIGTRPVAESQKFDMAALRDYFRDHVDHFSGELSIEQFKGGQSNPTFKLDADGRSYVVRTKPAPASKLLPSAHAVDREFQVMSALHGAGFPVPRQYALCNDESVIGRAFAVMEYVEGRVYWEQSLPGMNAQQRGEIYDEMNRVIGQLHAIDHAEVGLTGFGKPGNYFSRQIDRWTRQYRTSETAPIPAMDRLIDWLPQHIPPGDETTIVHGDYRMDNMIFHPTEPRIIALLDWELSTLGHPLADFSYHCMSWHIAPGDFRGIGGLDLATLGIPSEASYVARYTERTGRHLDPHHFRFGLVYNLFRMASILQGIMKRYIDGTASSAQALKAGQSAGPMAETGWRYASKQGSASTVP
jgi:aminoglycoside phosphotransferase (APT) family kinase protein